VTDETALSRIAEALERISPPAAPAPDFKAADAFVWHPGALSAHDRLSPVPQVARVDIGLLHGIDRARDTLLDNTMRFAQGFPANNVLLWGARGMGKSSLVKAAHADVNAKDTHYKSLKAALDGGVEGRPANAIFYATSNRRHLMPRDMIENEQRSGINAGEATEEKVSLSDRFGLWLGFHPCGQDEYLAMIRGYCDAYEIAIDDDTLRAEAIEWRQTRGAISGRVAWQFVQDLAGRKGVRI